MWGLIMVVWWRQCVREWTWLSHTHRHTLTVCFPPQYFEVTAPLNCAASKPQRRERTMATMNEDKGWWHHSSYQGDKRSAPCVTSSAQNRRWVTPASSLWRANQRAACHETHRQTAANHRAVGFKQTTVWVSTNEILNVYIDDIYCSNAN